MRKVDAWAPRSAPPSANPANGEGSGYERSRQRRSVFAVRVPAILARCDLTRASRRADCMAAVLLRRRGVVALSRTDFIEVVCACTDGLIGSVRLPVGIAERRDCKNLLE